MRLMNRARGEERLIYISFKLWGWNLKQRVVMALVVLVYIVGGLGGLEGEGVRTWRLK